MLSEYERNGCFLVAVRMPIVQARLVLAWWGRANGLADWWGAGPRQTGGGLGVNLECSLVAWVAVLWLGAGEVAGRCV